MPKEDPESSALDAPREPVKDEEGDSPPSDVERPRLLSSEAELRRLELLSWPDEELLPSCLSLVVRSVEERSKEPRRALVSSLLDALSERSPLEVELLSCLSLVVRSVEERSKEPRLVLLSSLDPLPELSPLEVEPPFDEGKPLLRLLLLSGELLECEELLLAGLELVSSLFDVLWPRSSEVVPRPPRAESTKLVLKTALPAK